MKLTNIEINNYKSIINITIENFKDINFFIGKNNTGKSNFIKAIKTIIRLNSNKNDIHLNSSSNKFIIRATFNFLKDDLNLLSNLITKGIYERYQSDDLNKWTQEPARELAY